MASPGLPPPDSESNIRVVKRYTLDRWRFPGVLGLVLLNIVGGLIWPWFGAISAQSTPSASV